MPVDPWSRGNGSLGGNEPLEVDSGGPWTKVVRGSVDSVIKRATALVPPTPLLGGACGYTYYIYIYIYITRKYTKAFQLGNFSLLFLHIDWFTAFLILEAFGVPGKRHLPPLNTTILFFEQLSRHQDLDKGDVAHYGSFCCPGETPFATFDRYYSLFLAALPPLTATILSFSHLSGHRGLDKCLPGSLKETCGALPFATFDRYYSLFWEA